MNPLMFFSFIGILLAGYIVAILILIKEERKENLHKAGLEDQLSKKQEMLESEAAAKKRLEKGLLEKEKELNLSLKEQQELKNQLAKKEEIINNEVASKGKLQEQLKSFQKKNEQLTQELASKETLYRELNEKYEALKAKLAKNESEA